MAYGVCPNCKKGLEVPEGYELCTCGACGQQISTARALELGLQAQAAPEASVIQTAPEASVIQAAPEAPLDQADSLPDSAAEQVPAPAELQADSSIAPEPESAPMPVPAPIPAPMPQAPFEPVGGQQYYSANTTSADSDVLYDRTENKGLYLAAFVLSVISCVVSGLAIIPLAWTIPMTVHTYGIYKGKKANTIAFGVCSLIFSSLISGILLLCAGKDEK